MVGSALVGVLSAEWIKQRRTATRWLVMVVPVTLAGLLAWYASVSSSELSWTDLSRLVFETWTTICVPVGAALFAGLSASLEDDAGGWWALRARPVSPAALYGAKLLVLAAHTLASSLVLGIFVGLFGVAFGTSPEITTGVPWASLLALALVLWVCALPLLALQLWVAEAWGFGAAVAVGVQGLLLAALIGGNSLGGGAFGVWLAVPWAWPVRGVYPALVLLGLDGGGPTALPVSPEGILLAVCAFSLVLASALTAAGLAWFSRREVVG